MHQFGSVFLEKVILDVEEFLFELLLRLLLLLFRFFVVQLNKKKHRDRV